MATLNEVMKNTADAIREKTGKSEKIAPVNFAEEIKGITAGGGESGGSTFEYLDITNVTGAGSQLKYLLLQMAYMCKIPQAFKLNDKTFMQSIGPAGGPMSMAGAFAPGSEEADTVLNGITAVSINFSDTINMQGQVLTIGEVLAMYVEQEYIDAIPRITKEQFYDLNA